MLDRQEGPDVRVAHVGGVLLEVDLAPLERRQVVERRTSGRDELELLKHGEGGQLHVRPSVRTMSQGTEGVGPVLGVEVVPV